MFRHSFAEQEDIFVSGNIIFYYVEGDPTQVISPDVMVCFGIPEGDPTSYGNLRLFDPATKQFLKTTEELAETVEKLSTENDFLKAKNGRLRKLLKK